MKKYLAVFVAVLVVVLLAACAPKTGVVHDKRYSPEHSSYTTICTPVGKVTTCHPQYQHYGPSWALDLYEGDKHGWRSVSEAQFNSVNIGDYYRG